MNFTDTVKFILFQSQLQIFISEIYAKQLPFIAMQTLFMPIF